MPPADAYRQHPRMRRWLTLFAVAAGDSNVIREGLLESLHLAAPDGTPAHQTRAEAFILLAALAHPTSR